MGREIAQDPEHQVLPFRPRNARPQPPMRSTQDGTSSFLVTLAKYEGGEGEDNYRHRMIVNVAGLLVTVALSIAGAWLVVQIADLRKNQDCVLSGRRNCTPIDASLLQR